MGVDLVVVNYRSPADLHGFCRTLAVEPPAGRWSLAIVNVEPHPEDIQVAETSITDLVHAVRPPAWVKEIRFPTNVGYARACNRAALLGTHKHLAFFNADTRAPGKSIDACVDALAAHPKWGMLGPRQVDDRGRLVHAGIFGTSTAPAARAWLGHNDPERYGDVRPDAVTVAGAALFTPRAVWGALTACPLYRLAAPDAEGAFLPTPHYFEETYCCFHARAHGLAAVYYGPACITHRWHQASPVGGWAERQHPISLKLFRAACDAHGMPHE